MQCFSTLQAQACSPRAFHGQVGGAGGIDTPAEQLSTNDHQDLVDQQPGSLISGCWEDTSEACCAQSP